jgi:hypothetical protein
MNHFVNATKMVSETPRMDASSHDDGAIWQTGCDIERELNAANAEIEEKRKDVVWLATEKAKLENYVMRLEEAGDAVAAIIGPPGSAHWADENQVDAAWTNWTKAKEAKL